WMLVADGGQPELAYRDPLPQARRVTDQRLNSVRVAEDSRQRRCRGNRGHSQVAHLLVDADRPVIQPGLLQCGADPDRLLLDVLGDPVRATGAVGCAAQEPRPAPPQAPVAGSRRRSSAEMACSRQNARALASGTKGAQAGADFADQDLGLLQGREASA